MVGFEVCDDVDDCVWCYLVVWFEGDGFYCVFEYVVVWEEVLDKGFVDYCYEWSVCVVFGVERFFVYCFDVESFEEIWCGVVVVY